MNRKSKFQALQQLEAGGDNADDAMVDDSSASKSTKQESKPSHVVQTPVVDDHAGADEDEEIT